MHSTVRKITRELAKAIREETSPYGILLAIPEESELPSREDREENRPASGCLQQF